MIDVEAAEVGIAENGDDLGVPNEVVSTSDPVAVRKIRQYVHRNILTIKIETFA